MTYSFNQIIEYIDGTRDLNFEAARCWAKSNGATFEEDINKREPYEIEHEETYMNPTTGETEVKTVSSPTIKRFFVIGNEPKPYVPTDDELKAQVRAIRNQYLEQTDKYLSVSDFPIDEETKEQYKLYRQYLRDYPETEGWYEHSPLMFEEWKQVSELEQIVASGD